MKDSKANRLGNYIFSKKAIDKMNDKIILLGNRNKITAQTVLIIRLVCSIFLFFVVLYISNFGYFFAPLITVVFYLSFVRVFIDSKIEKRRKILEKESIYFFEILTLSLEAGRNIKTSIEVTTNNLSGELCDEFKRVLTDVRYGMDLDEALNALRYRIPSDVIVNIILNIKEANNFGNSITDVLNTQIEYLRDKRLLEQKAYISKMPIKISIVSVIFFIPLIILLLLSPMIIELLG